MVHRPDRAHAADTCTRSDSASVKNGESLFSNKLSEGILQQGDEQRSAFLNWSSGSSESTASTSQADPLNTRSPSVSYKTGKTAERLHSFPTAGSPEGLPGQLMLTVLLRRFGDH